MDVQELIKLLGKVDDKDMEVMMADYSEDANELFCIDEAIICLKTSRVELVHTCDDC